MRILLISDVHANPWALNAVLSDAGDVDHVIFAGDSVNYGPAPVEALVILRRLEPTVVQGNHDAAVSQGTDPRASPGKQPIALAMRNWTKDQVNSDDLAWLRALPTTDSFTAGKTRFQVVHATPRDHLYDYRLTPRVDQELIREFIDGISASVLVVGHTHLPFVRQFNGITLVNPGSVGQPLDGDPRASYAIWENGHTKLARVHYDRAQALSALDQLPVPVAMIATLQNILLHGKLVSR